MTGVAISIDTREIDRLEKAIASMRAVDVTELKDSLAELGANQTKRRIADEKKAPDGTPWAPWSPDYAKTRKAGRSLLRDEGHLLESIQGYFDAAAVSWGTNLIYGATQQAGDDDRGIPARPYLGLSDANWRELVDVASAFIDTHYLGLLN